MKKSIASIFIAILLVLIVLGLVAGFFVWGQEVSEIFRVAFEKKTEKEISSTRAGFAIVEVYANNIVVKNKGEVVLDADKFYVFLNDSLVTATPDNSSIGPGEVLTLTVADPIQNKIVKVSGPYGKFDIIEIGPQGPQIDTKPPMYFDASTDSKTAGSAVEFRLRWTDNVGLSGYIFSLCNGAWNGTHCDSGNETYFEDGAEDWTHNTNCPGDCPWTSCSVGNSFVQSIFGGPGPSTGSYSIVFWDVDGSDVSGTYLKQTNDTSGCDYVYLKFNANTGSGNEAGDYCRIDASASGDSGYTQVWDYFTDTDPHPADGNWHDVEVDITSYKGSNMYIKLYGQPTYNLPNNEWCGWDDFKIVCGSRGWQNDTWTNDGGSFTGAEAWSNVTKTITDQVGVTVAWGISANDTSNNWNTSQTYTFVTE